jgi:hypothetical protein
MKRAKTFAALLSGALTVFLCFAACKREFSCEGCENNNLPPIAKAGVDQTIVLPKDSVLLDGSASADPDGNIASYQWTKIRGPASFSIGRATDPQTVVRNLASGVYLFELQVTDDKGATASDTVQVMVDDPRVNQPPVAKAGNDLQIVFPTDSVLLDGAASFDVDGTVTSYQWLKITGPGSAIILRPDSAKTQVNALTAGVYQFELTVKDNGGLSAKDTVMITVEAALVNQPPIACAGTDKTVRLPTNTVNLDGTCSTDPDNNITSYQWTKITGPSSFTIATATAAQTQISNLTEGVYWFELKVTDATNLSSKDTVQVTVNAAVVAVACGDTNRPRINARLIEVGTLSIPRSNMAVASASGQILFASGYPSNCGTCAVYTRVDIYNVATNTWSTAELSLPRWAMATVSLGNKIFFAGGDAGDGTYPVDNVDVYDASTNSWSLMHLSSRKGEGITAAAVGNKVLFGTVYQIPEVDIYDVSTNTWSKVTMTALMEKTTAVTVNNKAYFGGSCKDGIIIYDNSTNTWSTTAHKESMMNVAGVHVGGKIYWAGGLGRRGGGGGDCGFNSYTLCSVEVHDVNSGSVTMQSLSRPKAFWPNHGQNAVVKDNKIIFYRSREVSYYSDPLTTDEFDIYNTSTGTWSIGVLPFPLEEAAIISVNNTVYLAGGLVNGVLSDKVWKLEF